MKNRREHIFHDEKTKERMINEKLKKYESMNTPMKEWRQNEKLAILDIVASNLNMSGHNPTVFRNYNDFGGNDYNLIPIKSGHKDKAREIILKTDLRQLYRGGMGRKVEEITIITAIAMYVMRQDNPRRSDCRYSNTFIKKSGVTKEIYGVIAKNIDKLYKKEQSDKLLLYIEGENKEVNNYFSINFPDFETVISEFYPSSDLRNIEDLQDIYENYFIVAYSGKIWNKLKNLSHVNQYYSLNFILTLLSYSFVYSFVLYTHLVPEDRILGVIEYTDETNITYYYPDSSLKNEYPTF